MNDAIKSLNLKKTTMKSEDFTDSRGQESPNIDSSVFQLEMIHVEIDKLIESENDEILIVEQKYSKLKQSFYKKRSEIIENIPDFWFNVFTTHPDICNILYDEEEDCLRYLQKLEVEIPENIKSGYSIKLFFMENPYFRNDILIKDFFFQQGNFSSVSTKLEWKKPHPNQMMRRGSSNLRLLRKRSHQPYDTFFEWFANNDDANGDVIAEIIRDDIWPNSLQYYLVPDPELVNGREDDSSDDSSEIEEIQLIHTSGTDGSSK